MKAICSFILVLAVSSAGAQIRPVESLPIAVNYSKTIHLVFPSAVKYNQAVTDFVAVDNPESVPNILRIKANRKSFSKQTTVSVATEGGFFYSFNVTYADSLEHTNYFLPDMSSIRPDTIYLNEVSQTHLIAPEKVIYIDYGDTCIQVKQGREYREYRANDRSHGKGGGISQADKRVAGDRRGSSTRSTWIIGSSRRRSSMR